MVNLAAVSLHRHIAVLADFSFQVIFQVFGVWGSGDMYIQADVASLVGLSLCAISPKQVASMCEYSSWFLHAECLADLTTCSFLGHVLDLCAVSSRHLKHASYSLPKSRRLVRGVCLKDWAVPSLVGWLRWHLTPRNSRNLGPA